MKKNYIKQKSQGVSLITLIITIIVMIILAGAVIITLGNNNSTKRASEASFKSSISSYKEELSMYIANKILEDNTYNSNSLNVDKGSGNEIVNGENVTLTGIQAVIISMKALDTEIFIIKSGKLMISEDATEEQKKWAKAAGAETIIEFGTNGNTEENVASVNRPALAAGLTPIIFSTEGTAIKISETDPSWYAYIDQGEYLTDSKTSRWANAESQDGSQWVWIPRYAYKINYTDPNDKSIASQIDVVFVDINNKDINGNDYTNGYNGYIVHPAFRDGTSTNFFNGEWDSELTGIWIAKYEAGFSGVNGIKNNGESSVTYASSDANVLGEVTANVTKMTYPVFKPNAYSYNFINIGDSYALSRALTETNNPYGFIESANSHMLKNSEWGAISYLTQSKYGRNGIKVTINSEKLNLDTVCTITGYSKYHNSYNTNAGMLASTTGNMYGIYDMSGGIAERTAGYVNNGSLNLIEFGKKMLCKDNSSQVDGISNKFISVYAMGEKNIQKDNYNANLLRKGEAIWETSTSYTGVNSWFDEYSCFPYSDNPFFSRGDYYGEVRQFEGMFYFYFTSGGDYGSLVGFRTALCVT